MLWVGMGGHGWTHSCYGWAWVGMSGHMSCYGWAWVGIGRCRWSWSGYGYNFEGECWALLLTIGKILAVRLQGTLWARNRVGCSFEFGVGLGLWRLHTKLQLFELRGRGSSWPRVWTLSLTFGGFTLYPAKAPLTIFYWLFSAHFFRISTKFGHSTRTAIV
jgi:hypothetical protein